MGKKTSIVLVAMLCLSMLPWTSIGVGSEAKNVKSAEPLKVDAWVESKLAKPGDTIKIYANTSYTEGVSVSADIMEYEHSEDVISSLSLENLDSSGIIYTTYIATVPLNYDSTEKHWVGEYTIPSSSAGAFYVADVTATDGTNTVNDNATAHLYKFYDEWLKPVQDKAETFLYGEFNDTKNDIKENLTALNDTINEQGGIRSVVENLTNLPEWQALLNESYDPIYEYGYKYYYYEYFSEGFSDNASFEYNITVPNWVDVLELSGCCSYDWEAEVNVTVTLTDPDENIYTYDLNDRGTYMISSPTPGNYTINVTTSGNGYFSLSIDGYLGEKSRIACFLDNLTKFILSDEYESIKSMIPELKSFILGIPEENIIDYLLGFNLTHYLEKIEGTESIIEAYNAFMNSEEYADLLGSDEYADFQNALNASLQASETHWNMENVSVAVMDLLMSEAMMNLLNTTAEYLHDLLNETAEYLQGNDTVLQNLINSFVALDGNFNSQLETLVKLPEFKELINTVKNDPNLGPVLESINTTFNNINNSVETMKNSTQLQNLDESIQNLQKYMENNVLYEYEYFSEDETFNYNYTVKDWMKELCLDLDPYFDDNSEFVNDIWTWIPGAGNITVTLTDPNGVVYTYTEAYNGSEKKYEDGKHDYTIQFPAEGNWTINVTVFSDSGDGHYDLNIGPKDELFGSFFVGHMVRESLEEIFFVFNAGIAIETEYFQTIGSTGSAKLIAYDANGRIPNEEISVVVSRNTGGTLGASGIIPAAVLYTWVSGFTTTTSGGVYAISTGTWSGTGNSASASVISTSPTDGIKCSDITWQLVKTSDGTVVAAGTIGDGTWSGTGQTGSALTGADYLKAGCTVTVSLPETGEYKVRAIVGGSQIYESPPFTTSGRVYVKDKNPNEAPVAVAEVSSPMLAGNAYSFDASGSYDPDGYIAEYEWDFGDGSYGYGEYVEHTYTEPGTYTVILTVTDNESAVSTTTIMVEVVEAPAAPTTGFVSLFEAFPYIKQLMEEINPGIVYEAIVTTDSNGEATINFPVEEFGIYTIDAYFEDENRTGFGESAFIGESYIPEIGLTQIGKFAGIPVYMNPNKIGENITFNVNILENENASVGIGAIPLEELFPDINMSYESSDTTITGPDNVSLQVNGPISLIVVVTGIPFGPEEKEEEYPPYYAFSMGTPYTSGTNATFNVIYVSPPEGIPWNEITWQIENVSAGVVTVVSPTHIDMDGDGYFEAGDTVTVDTGVSGYYTLRAIAGGSMIYKSPYFVTSSTKTATVNRNVNEQPTSIFPQFNISFGILLTSNVSISLDVPSILKGERSQIDVSATGTPVITYGVACYANGLDIMSLDVTTLSKMAYGGAVYQKEYNLTDVMELMKSIICGPGNSAFVTIPKLAVDGNYSFITLTNVNNKNIGAAFTSVNIYAEAKEIPAVTSSGTVDNKDVAVTYVGSGKVTIKKATVTPPAPPANVKHIGVFVEVDTTGTVHDAFITIKYNDSDISGVDEAKLRMYYWNETINEWVLIPDSGVWTNNNTVWARVTHFTIFAPMAEKTAAGSAPGIGWLIYVGVFSAVIIIVVISLAVTVKRKKKKIPPPSP